MCNDVMDCIEWICALVLLRVFLVFSDHLFCVFLIIFVSTRIIRKSLRMFWHTFMAMVWMINVYNCEKRTCSIRKVFM